MERDERYRRPRRESYPNESFIEIVNRYFLRIVPKDPIVTVYPKGWKPSKQIQGGIKSYLSKTERKNGEKKSSLEKKVLGIISATLLGGSAFFVSTNITGSVIYSLSQENINLIGIIFFILGLAGLLFCIKKR